MNQHGQGMRYFLYGDLEPLQNLNLNACNIIAAVIVNKLIYDVEGKPIT